jgi:multidrug efflux pump subunit AcrA (membrane-fusion protein)
MFVQVRLVVARDVDAVMVPASAVYAVAGLTKVFVIRDGLAVEQRVPPGQTVDGWVEVPADRVKVGDQVAVSRLDALVNGMKVQPRS